MWEASARELAALDTSSSSVESFSSSESAKRVTDPYTQPGATLGAAEGTEGALVVGTGTKILVVEAAGAGPETLGKLACQS